MDLRSISNEELAEIIKKHGLWLDDKEGGEQADLKGASLKGANMEGAILDDAYLKGAILYGASLYGASLYGASLDGANLEGANMEGSNLSCSRLNGARLDGAKLKGAILNGASLYGASLYGANLDGVNLDGVSLNGAILNGAKGKVLAIGPIGSRNGITYAFWSDNDKSIHIQCGCFSGNFDEWKIKCVETHEDSINGRAYAAAAEFIAAFAVINNWEGK